MRDKRKNKAYFTNYIADELEGINLYSPYFYEKIEGKITKEKAAKRIFSFYLNLSTSTYSNDGNKEDLKIIVEEMLPYLEFVKATNYYVELLWVLSLAYILEIEPTKLELLKQRIIENKYDDYVVSTILNAVFPDEIINKNIIWDKPYAKLKPVLEAKEEAEIRDLEKYLTSYWYKGHSDCAWYESHKRENLAYAGYWSFETAALIKLFNLDDSSLKNIDYYPYDLLHFDDDII